MSVRVGARGGGTRTGVRKLRRAAASGHEFDALGLITWDLGAWYAEDPDWVTPGNGGAVSQWDDGGSGLARHMVQATSSRQPTYSAAHASFNNKPAVTVDGGDDLSTSGTLTAPTKPYSIVIIGRFASVASTTALFGRGAGGSGVGTFFVNQPTGEYRYYAGVGTLAVSGANTSVHLWRIYVNDASSVLEVDGAATAGTLGTAQNITSFGMFATSGGGSAYAANGSGLAFLGLYTGNVAAHGSWAAFKADAATHYGLTVA